MYLFLNKMAEFYITWIFLAVIVCSVSAKLSFLLNGVNIPKSPAGEPLRVIEGDRFLLKCVSDHTEMTVHWKGETLTTNNSTIEIERIQKEYSGPYVCTASGKNRYEAKRIDVEVLFPPSTPVIEGETTGIYGEEVTLNCSSDGLPVPLYEWRRENDSGIVLSRSQTLQTIIEKELRVIVCVVKSVINTTLGESRTERATREIVIRGNKKANIEGICNQNDDNVKEGDDIYLLCLASGTPAPDVWWTKVENNSFFFKGLRLVERNVDKTFTGGYICHARNTVLSVNKTSITTEVTKSISVQVIKSAPSKMISSLSVKESVLISGNAIGWTIIILIVIVLIVLRVKRKRKGVSHNQILHDSRMEDHGYSYVQNTSESYISQVRLPEQIYETHIDHEDLIDRGTYDLIGQEAREINEQNNTYLQPICTLSQNSDTTNS